MSDRDFARLARASVRRYAVEQDEAWHVEAHEVATALLAEIEGAEAPRPGRALAWARRLALLPPGEPGATSLRRTLFEWACDVFDAWPEHAWPDCDVRPGRLAMDALGRLSVVRSVAEPPNARWRREQRGYDALAVDTSTGWWTCLPLDGGALLLPRTRMLVVGDPSELQLETLLEHTAPRLRDETAAWLSALR